MAGFFANRRRGEEPAPPAPAPPAGAQQLSVVLGSLLRAVVRGRGAMDGASADLAKAYWADSILRSLPLPAFNIPEVKVRLKFAVSGVGETASDAGHAGDMRVIVDLATLEKLPQHLVSEIELRLTPQMLRNTESEMEEARGGRG